MIRCVCMQSIGVILFVLRSLRLRFIVFQNVSNDSSKRGSIGNSRSSFTESIAVGSTSGLLLRLIGIR